MKKESLRTRQTHLDPLGAFAVRLPWFDILVGLWKAGKAIMGFWAAEGMYEVLEFESTLELNDIAGKKAFFRKREKVRYLQNNNIAFQDQAWGDGEILVNYRCSPGTAVDFYRPGRVIYILISLRDVKKRGDIDDFNIEWGIRNGFLRNTEQWETEVRHRTKRLKVQVIFPKERPPQKIMLKENNRQRTRDLGTGSRTQLPDGRHIVVWETQNPHLYEIYTLSWYW